LAYQLAATVAKARLQRKLAKTKNWAFSVIEKNKYNYFAARSRSAGEVSHRKQRVGSLSPSGNALRRCWGKGCRLTPATAAPTSAACSRRPSPTRNGARVPSPFALKCVPGHPRAPPPNPKRANALHPLTKARRCDPPLLLDTCPRKSPQPVPFYVADWQVASALLPFGEIVFVRFQRNGQGTALARFHHQANAEAALRCGEVLLLNQPVYILPAWCEARHHAWSGHCTANSPSGLRFNPHHGGGGQMGGGMMGGGFRQRMHSMPDASGMTGDW
jgi:hypothetical protein